MGYTGIWAYAHKKIERAGKETKKLEICLKEQKEKSEGHANAKQVSNPEAGTRIFMSCLK